jgi:FKBP-type peptidyl-prolyl cis-trans isomerase (trigger factor)
MADRALTLDEFMEAIRPEIERQIDEQIAAEPDHELRQALRKYRSILISKTLDETRIANLERKLTEAEARLKPRLVETPTA